jgi:hypothetical protein
VPDKRQAGKIEIEAAEAQGSGNRAQRQRNEIAGIVGEGKVLRLRQPTRAADAPCDQRRGEPGEQIEK